MRGIRTMKQKGEGANSPLSCKTEKAHGNRLVNNMVVLKATI